MTPFSPREIVKKKPVAVSVAPNSKNHIAKVAPMDILVIRIAVLVNVISTVPTVTIANHKMANVLARLILVVTTVKPVLMATTGFPSVKHANVICLDR